MWTGVHDLPSPFSSHPHNPVTDLLVRGDVLDGEIENLGGDQVGRANISLKVRKESVKVAFRCQVEPNAIDLLIAQNQSNTGSFISSIHLPFLSLKKSPRDP